jgi:hypothetical protein
MLSVAYAVARKSFMPSFAYAVAKSPFAECKSIAIKTSMPSVEESPLC